MTRWYASCYWNPPGEIVPFEVSKLHHIFGKLQCLKGHGGISISFLGERGWEDEVEVEVLLVVVLLLLLAFFVVLVSFWLLLTFLLLLLLSSNM